MLNKRSVQLNNTAFETADVLTPINGEKGKGAAPAHFQHIGFDSRQLNHGAYRPQSIRRILPQKTVPHFRRTDAKHPRNQGI